MTKTVHSLAQEAYSWFVSAKRDDKTIYTLKLDRPDWVLELIRDAHGDFSPDDWRYETIMNALDFISGAGEDADLDDLVHDFADHVVDTYTHDRLQWLASNLHRASYCDEAYEQGLVDPSNGITVWIGAGQYEEAREIFDSVRRSLEVIVDGEEVS